MKCSDRQYAAQNLATCAPEELGSILAAVLGAQRCIVHAPVDDENLSCTPVAAFGEIHTSSNGAIVEYTAARDRMFSVLSLNGEVIALVQVCGPQRRPHFTDLDLQLLRIMSGFIATTIATNRRLTQGAGSIGPS
ncbi:hypothetical protein AWB75_05279 [Caballeronia catudaia]|uniref:GAF domain-containing protein n=1 Tax=Caballeronia catudaia TaxID=1777136 RepID=A0A158CL81_9BURK|nr:GAF domain-containing protein [Caballeronia catudaia]SAK82636.1 hypothetical protein AWB75_05279 [Caballeronia catudaia]